MAFLWPFDALGVSFADFARVAVEGDAGTIIGDSIFSKMWVCVGAIHVLANSSV